MESDIDMYFTYMTNVLSDQAAPKCFGLVPDHTVPRTVLAPRSPIVHALNHKERDKQKKFLLTGECGVILLKTIF